MESKTKYVRITVDGKEMLVEHGSKLSDALNIEKPCGGRGSCGKCKVKIDGETALACRYTVTQPITVETGGVSEIFSDTGASESGSMTENLAYVLDIGTTTLALALVSLDEGNVVKVLTAANPQRVFGADIIARIDYCREHTVERLQALLIAEINRMINSIGVSADKMYVAANVTMLHTLFGIDCSSIGVAPYTPAFLEGKTVPAKEIGIEDVNSVISLPSIASFVGADLVAGLRYIGMPDEGKYNLLIDLGTNAEVVLYSSRGGVCSAAAAGPCFEGANISCGMSASEGAICSFEIKSDKPTYKTVFDKVPVGICGTGLVDIISELIRTEVIDEGGYMEEDYYITDTVYLSCGDVRQYQLAKSAVYSAILSLMKEAGVEFSDISKMYISGGFSSKINVKSAAATGLLPRELINRAEPLNNSSLLGAVRYATEGGDLSWFTENIRYVDLTESSYFSDLYIENMMFDIE